MGLEYSASGARVSGSILTKTCPRLEFFRLCLRIRNLFLPLYVAKLFYLECASPLFFATRRFRK